MWFFINTNVLILNAISNNIQIHLLIRFVKNYNYVNVHLWSNLIENLKYKEYANKFAIIAQSYYLYYISTSTSRNLEIEKRG